MNRFEVLVRSLASQQVEFVIIGGVAASLHGSALITYDIDIVYARTRENIARLVHALQPFHPYLRGADRGLKFIFDEQTFRFSVNLTFTTDAGDIDCLGEIAGVGDYDAVLKRSIETDLYGIRIRCIDLHALIDAKRAAGRRKDAEAIAHLENIRDLITSKKPTES
jgi:predicted nucleotidyltransferase